MRAGCSASASSCCSRSPSPTTAATSRGGPVAVGLAIQIAFAVLVLRWSVGKDALDFVAGQVTVLIDYTRAGIDFLFADVVADREVTIFAFEVLPVIIFLGALVGLLYYLRVIQWVVDIFAARSTGCCARPRSSRSTRRR